MTALNPNPSHSNPGYPLSRSSGQAATGTARPLAFLLLAAAVAALAVAADRLMASWADVHLLATWVALWAVVFAGFLTLAGTTRRIAQRLALSLDQWARQRAASRAEARATRLARHYPASEGGMQASATGTVDSAWHGLGMIELGRYRRNITFHI